MIVLDRRKYAPEGADGVPGGNAGDNPNPTDNPSGDGSDGKGSKGSGEGDFVKREILNRYKTDLADIKSKNKDLQARLSKFEKDQNSREEEKLLEEKRYQELLEKRDAEIAELKGSHTDLQSTIDGYKNREITGDKLTAFMDKADFRIDSKYLSFVDIDSIKIGEDGEVVASTVTDAVDKFRKEHPSLILGKSKSPQHHQPGNGSDPSQTKLTKKQFNDLYRRDKPAAYEALRNGRVLET